jgi:hypothetical protein
LQKCGHVLPALQEVFALLHFHITDRFLDSTILHFAHMCEEILSCCQSLCAGHQPIHGTTERKGESGTKEIFEVPLFQYFLLQQGSVTTIG